MLLVFCREGRLLDIVVESLGMLVFSRLVLQMVVEWRVDDRLNIFQVFGSYVFVFVDGFSGKRVIKKLVVFLVLGICCVWQFLVRGSQRVDWLKVVYSVVIMYFWGLVGRFRIGRRVRVVGSRQRFGEVFFCTFFLRGFIISVCLGRFSEFVFFFFRVVL